MKLVRLTRPIASHLAPQLLLVPQFALGTSCGTMQIRQASLSSNAWLERQKKDVFVKKARYDNYRARSAYKLIEIDDKYKFLKPGKIVIEAGAAPGSWTQVIVDRLKLTDADHTSSTKPGLCLAIDIAAIQPLDGAICLGNADFTSPFTQAKILTWLDGRTADCVLSDMAPNVTGQKYLNHEKIIVLLKKLLPFAFQVLTRDTGVLLFKVWDGESTKELVDQLEKCFHRVKRIKPLASRGDSAEIFVLCQGFEGSPGMTKTMREL